MTIKLLSRGLPDLPQGGSGVTIKLLSRGLPDLPQGGTWLTCDLSLRRQGTVIALKPAMRKLDANAFLQKDPPLFVKMIEDNAPSFEHLNIVTSTDSFILALVCHLDKQGPSENKKTSIASIQQLQQEQRNLYAVTITWEKQNQAFAFVRPTNSSM